MRKGARGLILAALVLALSPASCVGRRGSEPQAILNAPKTQSMSTEYEVLRFTGDGSYGQNTYLLCDVGTKQAFIIDPGGRSDELEAQVKARGLTVAGILNTHGHRDHVGANGFYRARYRADVYAESADADLYQEQDNAPTRWFGAQGDLWDRRIRVVRTPGHTPGSVCFLVGNILFSGDTLFREGVGVTPDDASARVMLGGIRDNLLVLPPETLVYPGHDESTTIGEERERNPFLQGVL